jgi:general secretion pathway protein J
MRRRGHLLTPSPPEGGEGFGNGFTLVELLVALAIFALIATAGTALLGFSIEAQHDSAQSIDRIAALRRVSTLLSADLAQAVPRTNRDERGDRQRAFAGEQAGATFVRAGWTNDLKAPRSSLQKVDYRIVGDALVRRGWPMVDGVTDTQAIPSVLIRRVTSARLRYRKAGAWQDVWNERQPDAMPDAVELTLTIDGIGVVRQMFVIGLGR